MKSPSIINLVTTIIWAIIIFVLPEKYFTLKSLLIIQLTLSILKLVYFYFVLLKKNILIGETQNFFISFRRILKESLPYFLLVLVMFPVISLSNNFLEINSDKKEIAYFNLAQKFTGPVSIVFSFALSSIFPNLSVLWIDNEKKFKKIIKNGIGLFILSGIFLCFCFTMFTREIVNILFTENYSSSIPVCQLQIWFLFLMSINSLIGTIWSSINQEKRMLKTSVINAIISIPFLFFGSYFGAIGLSYGYIISFSIFEIYLWIEFKKTIKLQLSNDLIIWLIAIFSFLFSFFFIQNENFEIRLIVSVVYMIVFSIFFMKSFQKISILKE